MANASGFFELEVVALENPQGRLANGQCCGADETSSSNSGTCHRQCATHFRLCLKEYQSNVTVSSPCTYGNASSPVLAGNSFTFVEPGKSNARLVIPFSFRWPVSHSLFIFFPTVFFFFLHLSRLPLDLIFLKSERYRHVTSVRGGGGVIIS